jgi:peptidoglycan/LPS O-acetylase OafA/YrhL
MQKIYFQHLDALRTLAFMAVFYAHSATVFIGATLSDAFPLNILKKTSVYGAYGVNFFFILSGFLITYLLLKERAESPRKTFSIKDFYIKRVLRIWPVYFITIAIGVFILPYLIPDSTYGVLPMTNPNMDLGAIMYNLFFAGNFYQGMGLGIASLSIGILWSVAVEEQFYLVWPWIVKYCTPRRLAFVTAFLVACSLLFKFLWAEDRLANYYLPWSVGMDLGLGALLGISYFLKKTRYIIKSSLAIIGISLGLVGIVWGLGTKPEVIEIIRLVKSLVIDSIFVLILLYFINHIKAHTGIFAHAHKALTYLGKISYGLYAYHSICFMLIVSLFYETGIIDLAISRAEYFLVFVVSLTLSIAATQLSFRYIEKPILGLRKRLLSSEK